MSEVAAPRVVDAHAQAALVEDTVSRVRVDVRGAVQGVGFRPFVYRLATELALGGWVRNDAQGVAVEVEGDRARVDQFLARLRTESPPRAVVHSIETRSIAATGAVRFEIRASDGDAHPEAIVLADGATCAACVAEIADPDARRFRHPFTNCTDCGPRFSILLALPYDRPNTTMAPFPMCAGCRREYEDPSDRRFHAQPIACPGCGPRVELTGRDGAAVASGDDALRAAARMLREGRIVAVKGLGGFQLMTDADDEDAVVRLRRRKARDEKPFAVMARDLEQARALCDVTDAAARLLASPEAPIVLLPRLAGAAVAPSVAPDSPRLGVMLPTTPLHHVLLRDFGRPVVATSGNRSDEPICVENAEAFERLGAIADAFLVHDRPIARRVDDSVVSFVDDRPTTIRRARGYAPLPVRLARAVPVVLALGGHLKSTIALSVGANVFLSQHLGDLDTPGARAAFEATVADFLAMYAAAPALVAHDSHPDYASTHWLAELGRAPDAPEWKRRLAAVPRVAVQHHHAHLAACLAENRHEGPALGVTWDGAGHGDDGTTWGGEFLLGDARAFERVASLRPFRLPGGDAAARQPRRVAMSLLFGSRGDDAWRAETAQRFTAAERRLLGRMLAIGAGAPMTTSAGRLFDGVASLLDLRHVVSFEGQAAMALESAADADEAGTYPLPALAGEQGRIELDWRPMIEAVVADRGAGVETRTTAARFHNALVDGIVAVAKSCGTPTVALSGGCFQNRLLASRARARLEREGFRVLVHREVPPGDGGISLGQVAVAAARTREA